MGEVAFDGEMLDFSGLVDDYEESIRSPDIGVRSLEDNWSSFSGELLNRFKSDTTNSDALKYYGLLSGLIGDGSGYIYGVC
ncbi:MAG: hypothetical protein V1888_01360 [archaeon]